MVIDQAEMKQQKIFICLDESQFENEQDRKLAEETTRKRLGVPAPTLDEDKSILPHAVLPNGKV
ncbi:hypothetical protein [Nostoc sp.]|uniref:hypothetical protein n=1 Tax=Nostoc sp. TaxID=1180 RepID=UPI002FFBEEFD